ncbi:hypothetical protein M426DRAFT_213940 [Hypoxylon sp. CI-4A]|nr:hypothetical protein M426DRAFT_213940 [Hypoxylon sp. CI-4A]
MGCWSWRRHHLLRLAFSSEIPILASPWVFPLSWELELSTWLGTSRSVNIDGGAFLAWASKKCLTRSRTLSRLLPSQRPDPQFHTDMQKDGSSG